MSKKVSMQESVKFSVIPVVLATSCCMTVPALGLMGITMYEPILFDLRWYLRILALLLITLSLVIYFKRYNIKTWSDYRTRSREVLPTTIQTFAVAVFIYVFCMLVVVPLFCENQHVLTCTL